MIVEQNLSQEETRSRLKSVGFVVSKSQLEYKLRVWGFRKKAPKDKSRALWQHVGYRIDKRGLQGKSSQVWLNGRLVDSAKVRKEVNRHQPDTLSKIARGKF
ncbi:hypothetical protein CGCS363_v003843 [Colletotrichum siamense]|uniref:uncharacterized protein n=1 Tax=Colletotrichum siamense TaxID=690259 RepID=UPI0018728039|nr:uncharacterized protein CGCS363_v003843 [Colletotrichum siamense]KAF5510254.1 hypothetical protein CGCS363_v003843 [Colletotrichum siamense]